MVAVVPVIKDQMAVKLCSRAIFNKCMAGDIH